MADNNDNNNNNKYNVEAAEILANEALHLPITEAAPIYEQLLAIYPTAAKFWKQYVEAQMAVNNDDATKQIFSRCLLNCLQVPLWRCYIRFIKKVNEKKGFEGQEETRKAFDFMLNYVGADIASGPVWMEYISFLKSIPTHTAQEETQRMIAVRKAYQKAIVTPTHHVEQLWKNYENFENSVSRALAKGLVSEYQPKYNSARAVYRERKKYIDEIDWNILAVPPAGSCKEEQQWMAWKRLLAFEIGNPQRIDSASSNKRIVFTYEQVKSHEFISSRSSRNVFCSVPGFLSTLRFCIVIPPFPFEVFQNSHEWTLVSGGSSADPIFLLLTVIILALVVLRLNLVMYLERVVPLSLNRFPFSL